MCDMTQLCVSRSSGICMTWRSRMCDITLSHLGGMIMYIHMYIYMKIYTFIHVSIYIYIYVYMSYGSDICVTWHGQMCDITLCHICDMTQCHMAQIYVWHDTVRCATSHSVPCATWQNHTWAPRSTCTYFLSLFLSLFLSVFHSLSFPLSLSWRSQMCDMTQSFVWHDSVTRVTRRSHTCDMALLHL